MVEADRRRRAASRGCREERGAGIDSGSSAAADESYTLTGDPDGVVLKAPSVLGVLHGLATLRQLAASADAPLPAFRITDAPRFGWPGLMIDTARHFMTVPTLKRQIDAMQAVKLNVLHLHLSDSEAFRVESRLYPKLTEVSGHGETYSQADMRDVVAYAHARSVRIVRIVREFDVPAHTAAILAAYPELGGTPPDPRNPLSR